jgi:ribosomal protein S18 acetylase RimI-like enzyme
MEQPARTPGRGSGSEGPAIRRYRPADRDAVLALWRAVGLDRPPNEPEVDLANIVGGDRATLFVADAPGEPERLAAAGRCAATIVVAEDGHRGWIYYVAVAPELQGRGLGRAMVRHAEAHLAARGVPKMLLLIRNHNAAVQAFYERLGYAAEPCLTMGRWLADAPGR